jgi:glutamate/tyrosine decarboxylase-like PLP-dependent enzyme
MTTKIRKSLKADGIARKAALSEASRRGLRYLEGLRDRRVFPASDDIHRLDTLGGPVPEGPTDPQEVLRLLDETGSPATVASAGGRYFGFVVGSADTSALAASWLSAAWNQNAAMFALSPAGARIEQIALGWIREMLRLPTGSEGAFVTGATMANFSGLAAARHSVLAAAGWNVEEQGLAGAPPITVAVSEETHVSALKAISMLGLGRSRVVKIPTDSQGRVKVDALPRLPGPSIICLQAGNVNSGSFDPIGEVCHRVKGSGTWVHVDGAFGLWAAVAESRRHLTEGASAADSWALDGHKWLNVPYDSGLVFVRNAESLRSAMGIGSVPYLIQSGQREPSHFTPELSRRARGVEAWAAIRALGRSGIAAVVERTCQFATQLADGLRAAGYEVLNDVVLNQVLVSFGDDATTSKVIADLQDDGTCWCGGTRWHGRSAMRVSISSWATTQEDIDRCLAVMLRIARAAENPGRARLKS